MNFRIVGQVLEAYVHSGEISLIQGNTIENSILHHIREKGGISPGEMEKELLPILPEILGERLLLKYEAEGKLVRSNNSFKTASNWKPEDGRLPLPENSILKVYLFQIGETSIVFGAILENDRQRPKREDTRQIAGAFSMALVGRTGYSVFAESLNVFRENRIGEGAELIIDSSGARFVWENRVIKNFDSVSLKELISPNLDLEKNQTRVVVQNPKEDSFLKPEVVETLDLMGMELKLAQPLRFKKVPLNENSAVNAIFVLIRQKQPNAETYKAVVNHIWSSQAESWGFDKETLFPEGFPSYGTYQSILGEN